MIGKFTKSASNQFLAIIILTQTFQNVIINVNGDRGSFVGCYHQNLYFRRLSIFSGSSDVCINECEALYFRYAVLEGNACLCSNTINEKELKDDECDRPCAENHKEFCGGEYAQSYYDTGVNVPGPPTHLQVIKRTENSILVGWAPPEQRISLSRYFIWTNLTRKYGTKMVSPLPFVQWTIEKTDRTLQYELINLNPGSTYNISITSNSEKYGGGGSSWMIADTEIGEPDPVPPQPATLKSDGRTMMIEIPALVNNNGPITAVQVVVVFVDAELSQQFDENLLKGHSQATEDGTNYYITAELPNETAARKFVVGNGLSYGGYDNVPLPIDRSVHMKLGIISHVGSITKKRYSIDNLNELYETKQLFVIDNQIDDGNGLETALLIGISLLGVLLVLSIIGYVYLRLKMDPQMRRLPSDHHELTLQGPILEMENNTAYQPDGFPQMKFDDQLNGILDQIDSDKNHAKSSLALDVNNLIATGHYGDIIGGRLQTKPTHVHVISDDMETFHQIQFLKDLAALVRLNPHKNLIEFYGICKSNNFGCYLLFEDVGKSLKTLLIDSRMQAANSNSLTSLSELDVIKMLCELSSAMEFLHKQKFIHGKLTSYNIWITNDNIPKIGCFGAVFNSQGKTIDLSRWSAPEVLRFQHYSTQSDIWSFGCLIWECCSVGGTLYSSINSNDLATRIKDGATPDPIPYVNDDMRQLLINCWQLEPSERIKFKDITSDLWTFLASPQHILSFERRLGSTLPFYSPSLEAQSF